MGLLPRYQANRIVHSRRSSARGAAVRRRTNKGRDMRILGMWQWMLVGVGRTTRCNKWEWYCSVLLGIEPAIRSRWLSAGDLLANAW